MKRTGSDLGLRRVSRPWICTRCSLKGRTQPTQRSLATSAGSATFVVKPQRKLRDKVKDAIINTPSLSRHYHTPSSTRPASVHAATAVPDDSYFEALTTAQTKKSGIRKHLAEWQEKYGTQNVDLPSPFAADDVEGNVTNDSMRMQAPGNAAQTSDEQNEDDFREATSITSPDDIPGVEYQYLSPGDLVEVPDPGNRESTLGIFVRRFGVTCQIYCLTGKWVHVKVRLIPFSIPKFLNPDLLDHITPYLPQEESTRQYSQLAHTVDVGVPREKAAPVLTKLLDFWRDVQEVHRIHATILDSAHDVLAHQTDLRFGTLEKIAVKLLGGRPNELSNATLFAVKRALNRSPGFGEDLRSHRFTRVFLIQPKDRIRDNNLAADWIRQWQDAQARKSHGDSGIYNARKDSDNPKSGPTKVDHFILKARKIIRQGRELRPANGLIGLSPSSVQYPITIDKDGYQIISSDKFNDSDRVLVRFLTTATMSKEFRSHPQYQALSSALTRGIDMSSEGSAFSYEATFKLLQEMGVLRPYENRSLHDEHLLLPNTQRSKPLEKLRTTINRVDEQAKFTDTMQHLRQDWKDLNVYAIDGRSALNIDDGISIEPVPEHPGQWWIRVHVANPTARIRRDHDVARMAAHMTETFYAPDDHHWLMPSWITQKFMSIAPDRPVLTFSARIDKDCNMLEYDVRPGIVRKVLKVTPRALSKLLGLQGQDRAETVITVGNAPDWFARFDIEDELPKISDEQRQELNTLLDLATARSRYRVANGGMMLDFPSPSISTTYGLRENAPMVSQIPLGGEAAKFVQGDPAIRLGGASFSGFIESSVVANPYNLVMEMMLLAGEVGARWCSDRNIPIMYRGTFDHGVMESAFTAKEFHATYVQPHLDKTGKIPYNILSLWVRLVGATGTSLTPLRHSLMGLSHYTKLTTPLGRYGDMITHWQIESALREEARTGKSLVGSRREDYLAFTRAELLPVVPRLRAREQLIVRSKGFCEEHWEHQLFFRAHHFREAELPATHEVIIQAGSPGVHLCMAVHKQYGVVFQVALPTEAIANQADGDMFGRAGDHWEVEIDFVDTVRRVISCKPVKLLYREPYNLEDLLRSDLSALAT